MYIRKSTIIELTLSLYETRNSLVHFRGVLYGCIKRPKELKALVGDRFLGTNGRKTLFYNLYSARNRKRLTFLNKKESKSSYHLYISKLS